MASKKDARVFRENHPTEELRSLLRSHCSAEELAAMTPKEVRDRARMVAEDISFERSVRAQIEVYVSAGRVAREEADAMTFEQMRDFVSGNNVLRRFRAAVGGKSYIEALAEIIRAETKAIEDAQPRPEQLVAALSDMLALVAKQQTQIDELVYERDVFLAAFADRILDKLKAFSDGGRNYKGFEVTLDLEDEEAEKRERALDTKTDVTGSSAHSRDTHAEIRLVANQIGALGGGRKINVDAMNRKVESLKAAARSDVKSRRRGRVTVKVGEISGKGTGERDRDR